MPAYLACILPSLPLVWWHGDVIQLFSGQRHRAGRCAHSIGCTKAIVNSRGNDWMDVPVVDQLF